jgi:cytochrome c oxidase subunit 2
MARPMPTSPETPRRLHGDAGAGKLYVAAVILWLLASVAMVLFIVGTDFWHTDAPLNTFNPFGENAQKIQDLVVPVFVIAGVVFLLVEGLVLFVALRNRQNVDEWDADTDFPEQSHGNTKLEIFWTAAPAVLLAVIAVQSVGLILDLSDFEDTEMVVVVEGQQWWWQYKYDNNGDGEFGGEGDIISANELVIPADTNVEMRITSNDVIHSFWIPSLNGKKDAVPNMVSNWRIQADEPGRFRGTCTEFCGLSHARMQMYVIALDDAQYAEWETAQLAPAVSLTEADFDSPEEFAAYEAGQEAFGSQCTACHTIRTDEGVLGPEGGVAAQVSGTAPDLTHLMSRDFFAGATLPLYIGVHDDLSGDTPVDNYVTKDGFEPDVNNLEAWLRNPEDIKPMAPDPVAENAAGEPVGRGMPDLGLTEQQIDDLIAYLTTLK